MGYVDRYAEMLTAKRRSFALLDGQLFVRQQNWVMPLGPASQRYALSREQAAALLKQLGGWWVVWTGGFESADAGSKWYAVVCRRFTLLEEMPAKRRYEVKRGLKNCVVRRVEAIELAHHGYETHIAALQSYSSAGRLAIPTREQFASRVLSDVEWSDVRHHWAVYSGDNMVAFAQCNLYEKREVDYTVIKLHPEHLHLYPAYALIYRMNEFYLSQQGFEYVNDGWRSILHETGVQDFLIGKFNFEKAPARLHVHFRQPLALMLQLSGPLHPFLKRLDKRLASVLELRRLSSRPETV